MSTAKKSISERFLEVVELLKEKGFIKSYSDFYHTIGISGQKFHDIKKGRSFATIDMLHDMQAEGYPISLKYIVNGEGMPLESLAPAKGDLQQILNGQNIKPVIVTVDKAGQDNIVMVDTKAAAGYLRGFDDVEYFKDLPAFTLPGPEFRNATFRCFEVEGDSMEEVIFHKDWVIGKYIENFNYIKEGYVYVVVTNEGIVVKRVFNKIKEDESLLLVSDNDQYPPYKVDVREVRELWYVARKLSSYLPSGKSDTNRQIAELHNSFLELKNEVRELKTAK